MQFKMDLNERLVVHYCSANDEMARNEQAVVTILDASGDEIDVNLDDVPWLTSVLDGLVAFDEIAGDPS